MQCHISNALPLLNYNYNYTINTQLYLGWGYFQTSENEHQNGCVKETKIQKDQIRSEKGKAHK